MSKAKDRKWYDEEIMDGFLPKGLIRHKLEGLNEEKEYLKQLENPVKPDPNFFKWLAAGKI
jgi:hypothetical protein